MAKEHQQSLDPTSVLKIYSRIITHRQFTGLALSISCAFSGLFLYIAGAPTVIYDFMQLTSNDFGLLFIPIVIALIIGSLISGRLAHRLTKILTIRIGFSIMTLGVIFNLLQIFLLDVSVLNIVGPLVIYVFGLSLIIPAITIMLLDFFPKNRGSAASIQGFYQMMISACVAGIAVPILQISRQHFVFGQVGLLLAALVFWYLSRPKIPINAEI